MMLSAEPKIAEGVTMTELEKRLARRIHNQRRRLAQMEDFTSWRNGEHDRKIKIAFMQLARERWDKIKKLEAKQTLMWTRGFWQGAFPALIGGIVIGALIAKVWVLK